MPLFLHKALCKGERGPKAGTQTGGDYLKRVQAGVKPDGTPDYRYLRTQEEVAAYHSEQKQSGKKKDEGKKRLKEKLKGEQEDSSKKTKAKEGKKDDKKKDKKKGTLLSKSLYVDLTWGTPDVPLLVLGDK